MQPESPDQKSNQHGSYTAPPMPSIPKSSSNHESWRSILFTIIILILAPIVAIMLTKFAFQSYEVDGPSMQTTLENHDRLIVWKVPKTIASLSGKHYIPGRGDIIVFDRHDAGSLGGDRQLIKRVIALPGERVVVKQGKVTVYNKSNPGGINPDTGHPGIDKETQGSVDLTVPEGQVFVMGDNRDNSLDSRIFGPVDSSNIVGRLSLRIFPFNKAKSF